MSNTLKQEIHQAMRGHKTKHRIGKDAQFKKALAALEAIEKAVWILQSIDLANYKEYFKIQHQVKLAKVRLESEFNRHKFDRKWQIQDLNEKHKGKLC